jgi:hypothetical protein
MGATAGIASVVGNIGGSILGGIGASQAGSAAANYDKQALALAQQQMSQNTQYQQPFITTGQNALSGLAAQPGITQSALNTSFNNAQNATNNIGTSTLADLQALPGYQQALATGLGATQASASARGLGISGTSLKGAANFATGLAGQQYQQLYQQQLGIAQAQQQQNVNQMNNQNAIFGQYNNVANLGENAASALGGQNTQATGVGANSLQAAGGAMGSATNQMYGSFGNALNGIGSSYQNYQTGQNQLALGSAYTNYLNNLTGAATNAAYQAGANQATF